MIERAEVTPPEALHRLAEALDLRELPAEPAYEPQQATLRWLAAVEPAVMPLYNASWMRPPAGGDTLMAIPVARQALLVVAIDVAGHGASSHSAVLYLRGWLRGRSSLGSMVPRLGDLADDLLEEMRHTGIEASFYLALLQRFGDGHVVGYEAACHGYPPPLLLVGGEGKVVDSVPPVGRNAVVALTLSPPWRLVIASDGLLSRIGGGSEQDGRRMLLRWQRGPDRDQSPQTRLATDAPLVDDESLLLLAWDGWDTDLFLELSPSEHERVLRLVREKVEPSLNREAALRLIAAAHEVLGNVREHAGVSSVRVRLRLEAEAVTLDVTDFGLGASPQALQTEGRGLSVIRRQCDHVEFRRPETGGTTVTLVVRKR
jgi:anti-sigma regulatory factor (Ser/Thr protein kinase)